MGQTGRGPHRVVFATGGKRAIIVFLKIQEEILIMTLSESELQ